MVKIQLRMAVSLSSRSLDLDVMMLYFTSDCEDQIVTECSLRNHDDDDVDDVDHDNDAIFQQRL